MKVFKEVLISIFMVLVVAILVAILTYNYLPSTKMIPSEVPEYKTSEELKKEITTNKEENDLVLEKKVYEITDADLTLYKKKRTYNPGKPDPFSDYVEPVAESDDKGESSSSGNSTTKDTNSRNNFYESQKVNRGTK